MGGSVAQLRTGLEFHREFHHDQRVSFYFLSSTIFVKIKHFAHFLQLNICDINKERNINMLRSLILARTLTLIVELIKFNTY